MDVLFAQPKSESSTIVQVQSAVIKTAIIFDEFNKRGNQRAGC